MNFDYPELISALNPVQRLRFYELFAHFLTVSMRGILFFEGIPDQNRVERAKWLNEIAHRITYKVFAMQKNQSKNNDADVWQMIRINVEKDLAIEADVNAALELSYNYLIANEIESI